MKNMLGKFYNVLFLKKLNENIFWGRTDKYSPVYVESETNILGKIKKIKIVQIEKKRTIGRIY